MTSLLADLFASLHEDLNEGQKQAARLLNGEDNVFITGGAGSGKSYLLRKFLRGIDPTKIPVLASTGAAAVLIGGRTFHSFFGLGILEGGPDATIERALKDRRLARRLKKMSGFVLDEISMIPGSVLETAERIASLVRDDERPWGGLKMIAVGDFAQLPPITLGKSHRDWAFLNPVWEKSKFQAIQLTEMMRSKEMAFNEILGDVREGIVSDRVKELLDWRSIHEDDEEVEASVLYARKVDVERINLSKLARLSGTSKIFETAYTGDERTQKTLANTAPVPPKLELKKKALVMIRQNDPQGRWVNGSLGHVVSMKSDTLEIELMNGRRIDLEKARFSVMSADGNEIGSATNFPVNLAYAITIHKAQGATLDRVILSLKQLWEPGQAYVALSRVKSSEGLFVDGWEEASIFADPLVKRFHDDIGTNLL